MTGRERFVAACKGGEVDRPPVWLMRQAGRYLPEYRELKGDRDFWTLVRTPELAAEVTLQPVRRYGMDAAIIFCDILVVPHAMGVEVAYGDHGPELGPLVATLAQVEQLRTPRPAEDFGYLAGALRLVRARLGDRALIGFAGGPLTLAAYMIEGKVTSELVGLKTMAYRDPGTLDLLMGRLVDAVADLLVLQVEAGADAVQIFDTWAGKLSPGDYARWASTAQRAVVEKVRERTGGRVPIVLYVNGSAGVLDAMASTGADVLSLDARTDLGEARRRLGPRVALQGNLDPVRLLGPVEDIGAAVREMVEATGGHGHIVNLGHGVLPPTPVEAVEEFVRAVGERDA